MRVPNLRYDRMLWVLFLAVVAVILFSAVRSRSRSMADDTRVEIIPLAGDSYLIRESDVRQLLLRTFGNTLKGTELARLPIEEIEQVLEKNTFIANADVYVDGQKALNIKVTQREPVLRVMDTSGGNYYIDKNGTKMQTSEHFAAHVLVATGKLPTYTADFMDRKRNRLRDAFMLTQRIQEDEFLKGFVQQIHLNNNEEFVLVPLIGDQLIVLGSIRRLEEKIKYLKEFYLKGMPYAGWRKYSRINLKYTDQVVCER
jgi:cell division protein FtsQ